MVTSKENFLMLIVRSQTRDDQMCLEMKMSEAVDEAIHVYSPPEAKEWIDQGGASEVACEMVVNTRPKVNQFLFLRSASSS